MKEIYQKEKALSYFQEMIALKNDRDFQVAESMYALRESGLSDDELFIISCKLQKCASFSAETFLHMERLDAARFLVEFGISEARLKYTSSVLPKLTNSEAKAFLLSAEPETFCAMIDIAASENRDYYHVSSSDDMIMQEEGQALLQKLQTFLKQKRPLLTQINEADQRANQQALVNDKEMPVKNIDFSHPMQR